MFIIITFIFIFFELQKKKKLVLLEICVIFFFLDVLKIISNFLLLKVLTGYNFLSEAQL